MNRDKKLTITVDVIEAGFILGAIEVLARTNRNKFCAYSSTRTYGMVQASIERKIQKAAKGIDSKEKTKK